MIGLDRAGAGVDRRTVHALNAEQFQRVAGARDVADGIHRANFVEVHLLDGHAVDLRFRRSQHFENVDRVRLGRLRQRRRFNHLDDVRQVAMLVLVLEFDVEFRSGDAVALDPFHGEACSGAERVEPSEKCLSRRARVDQGRDGHVAGDAGERVEMGNFHVSLVPSRQLRKQLSARAALCTDCTGAAAPRVPGAQFSIVARKGCGAPLAAKPGSGSISEWVINLSEPSARVLLAGICPSAHLSSRWTGTIVASSPEAGQLCAFAPSAVLLRNATPSVFHQRHLGRMLRSSCIHTGRRPVS